MRDERCQPTSDSGRLGFAPRLSFPLDQDAEPACVLAALEVPSWMGAVAEFERPAVEWRT